MDSYQGRLASPGSLHKYLYSQGDPVNHFDPSGHEIDLVEVQIVAAITTTLASAEGLSALVLIQGVKPGGQLDLIQALGIYSIPETPLGMGGVLGKELVLRYTQTTARPYFDPDGKFKGETVSSLSKKIQSGDVKVSDVEIHYVERDGNALIINTRSSIALQKRASRRISGTGSRARSIQIKWTNISRITVWTTKAPISYE